MTNSVTTPRNNIVRDLRGAGTKQLNYPLSNGGSFDFFQGDLLYWDAAAAYVKPIASDANAAYLVGVALRSAYLAPYYSMQYLGGPSVIKNYYDSALVGIGCVATFYSTSGDTYNDGDPVFFGGTANNSQIVTNTVDSNTHSLGVVRLPSGGSAISGSATTLVPVLVIPQYPVQSL